MNDATLPEAVASSTPAAEAANASPRQRRRGGAWPIALVLITLILVGGVPMGYFLIRAAGAPNRIVTSISQAAADAVRPRITISDIVLSSIADLHQQNKLVVFEAQVNADITRDESESSWGVYWGSNTARVAVRDARVQFFIDLSRLGTGDFEYNDSAKVLTVTLPKPRIDTSMVAIDPAKIQTLDLRGGWALFDKQDTRDRAIAQLRPSVINEAQAPFVTKLASDAGIDTLTHFLQPLADNLAKDGATIKVVYVQ